MCKASMYAKHVEQAEKGVQYGIGTSQHGLPAFHPKGKTTAECVSCVKDGEVLTLLRIPFDVQRKHRVAENAVVTFVDTGDNRHDLIRFENGTQVSLGEFAGKGVIAYVGALERPGVSDLSPVRKREIVRS